MYVQMYIHTTDSTENTTPLKSTKSSDSNPLVCFPVKSKSEFVFVPRDTEEFLDVVNFGDVAFAVETVVHTYV